jgi:hypothetical protein
VLSVSGQTVTWQALSGVNDYVLATIRNPATTRDTTYQFVSGTSVAPTAFPGETVKYGMRANVSGAPWGNEVSIAYAATPTPAPPVNPTPTPPSSSLRVGLNANAQGYGSGMGGVQDGVRATGAGWTREAFAWDVIEPQSGSWDFSRYDAVLLSAAQRGLMVLPVLMTAPGWAAPAWNAIPSDPTAYGDYVAHVAARYGPGGSFWSAHPDLAAFAPQYFEIWNEPYYVQFSNNDINPGRYARLVKAAGQAGKAANPQAKFLAAAETDVQPTGGSQWVSWTDAMYQAVPDLNNYFDGVAVHPYSGNQAPDAPVNGYVHDKFVRMQTIRDKFVSHGAANKPFWITEIGWSTCTGNNECVSESNQAAYTAKLFDMIKTTYSSYVQGIFLYHYTDFGNGDPNDREQWYGMIHRDGSHKPVYNVLHTAAA